MALENVNQLWTTIKEERTVAANTAERVGQAGLETVAFIEESSRGEVDTVSVGKGLDNPSERADRTDAGLQ